MNAEQAWQSVLGQLQMEMPRAPVDTWVRGTKPVSYQDGTSTVGVRNAYAREWLASRLASTVNRLPVTILKVRGWVNHVLKGVDEISMLNRFGDVSKEFEEQLQDIRQRIEHGHCPAQAPEEIPPRDRDGLAAIRPDLGPEAIGASIESLEHRNRAQKRPEKKCISHNESRYDENKHDHVISS